MIRLARVVIGAVGLAGLGLSALLLLSTPVRLPLDLPAASAQGPGGTVAFYGLTYEGDDFYWSVDRSCSTGWTNSIAAMQAAVTEALMQLSPGQQFSLNAFGSNVSAFSGSLVPVVPGNVDSAITWVNNLTPLGATCLEDALLFGLGVLVGGSGDPALFLVADGEPFCGGVSGTSAQVIAAVTAANTTAIPIHTFRMVDAPPGVEAFLQELAALNGGTYLDTEAPPSPSFRRGDVSADGSVNIADAILILDIAFSGGTPPTCEDAADTNDDGSFQGIPDAITLLSVLFLAGTPPLAAPYPDCGVDPTADALDCTPPTGCP